MFLNIELKKNDKDPLAVEQNSYLTKILNV